MFKWLKKVINNNNSSSSSSSSDLNDEGLQSDLNDLYIVYDSILNYKRFDGYLGSKCVGNYQYLSGFEIKKIISDTLKLTGDHPELLLHLDKLNEYVFKLKMATTTLLDIYDNKDNLAQDVYKQQKSDAKKIIFQLVHHISDCNKKLSGLYQDENSATINFLKKQMGMTVDDPQEEYGKFYKEHVGNPTSVAEFRDLADGLNSDDDSAQAESGILITVEPQDSAEAMRKLFRQFREHGAGINGAWRAPIVSSEDVKFVNMSISKSNDATNEQDEGLYGQAKKANNDLEHERQIDNKIEEIHANKIYSGYVNANKLCSGDVDDTNRKIKQA